MYWFRLIAPTVLASQLVLNAAVSDPAATNPQNGSSAAVGVTIPPVLRSLEPVDSGYLVLPGPSRPATPAVSSVVQRTFKTVAPVAKMAKIPTKLAEDPILRQPLPQPAAAAALPAKPAVPADVEREIALYCQKQIGHWKEADARGILGDPKRQRPAYDERKSMNGTIYAFPDPTGRYKDLELDFDRETGHLRSVFVYPPNLTWQECRRQWAGPFTAADAKNGRRFYSYTNRRLDVLVESAGKVVSLGLY